MSASKRSKQLKQARTRAADANRLNNSSVAASAFFGGDNSMVDENPESGFESEDTEELMKAMGLPVSFKGFATNVFYLCGGPIANNSRSECLKF
jgi:hypothetical protein